jgi:hypothetical protein
VPLATYQDALGAPANTNPCVLDAAGSASIWLSSSAYKIVLADVNHIVQWTQDNVSAVPQSELQGLASFSSLAIARATSTGFCWFGFPELIPGRIVRGRSKIKKPPRRFRSATGAAILYHGIVAPNSYKSWSAF